MAASWQQKLAKTALSEGTKKFLKRQWWKFLIEAVPIVGDISPTFFLIVYSELKEREKQGGNGMGSADGIMMLFLAGMTDAAGWGALALDAALGVGLILSPAIAANGYAMIGIWQVFTGGSSAPPKQEEQENKK